MRITVSCALLVVAGGLAACSGTGKQAEENPNVFPAKYKEEVIFTLQKVLDDPTNVREAGISDPVLVPVAKDQRYAVCVRYNARDLARRYVGPRQRIAYFYGGHLNQLVEATPDQCDKAAYKPFPELEKLCIGTNKCL
ncbi:MAG: hypothetical protein ACK4UO_13830 [Pseudolabrys sp.]